MAEHGKSIYIDNGLTLIASADFYDFAPMPCVCYSCCNSSHAQKRQYARVWDNRLEQNTPVPLCGCLTCDEKCVFDNVQVTYFDKVPHRAGMCCFCIPFTCCGPPVIFNSIPKCCCIDCKENCGEQIKAAPSSYFGLKAWLCCGDPCYAYCACPIIAGIKDGATFLSKYKSALMAYQAKTGIDKGEFAIFENVQDDGMLNMGGAQSIPAASDASTPGAA